MGTTFAPRHPALSDSGAPAFPDHVPEPPLETAPRDGRRAVSVALLAVCLVAAGLRFWAFGRVEGTPFYDAAVRSMGTSWHNLFYGAIEPGGRVAIDKTPVDLWLQVASTKLFGFSSVALRLPQALVGTLAVPLLFDLVRRGFGARAGLAAALALAVLPVSVLTSRSDTMDTLLGTLLLLAVWIVVRARPERVTRAAVLAGLVAGLAFEVKLFQAFVGLPALALLVFLAAPGPLRKRAGTTAAAGVAFVVVAAAWPVIATVLPGRHPVPLGSTDGSIASVLFGYNGLDRLGAPTSGHTSANLSSLLQVGSGSPFASLIGVELAAALLLGGLALLAAVLGRRGDAWRSARHALRETGGAATPKMLVVTALAAWLLTGLVVFSVMGQLRPRYLEAFSPAVAGVLGVGLVTVGTRLGARRPRVSTVVMGVALAVILAIPTTESARLVRVGAGDAGTAGRLPDATVARLSGYLRAHQGTATRFQVAASGVTTVAPLIVRDARPVLVLGGIAATPLVPVADLRAAVRAGEVRFVLAGTGRSKLASVRWAERHGVDVSAAAGLPRRLRLLQVGTAAKRPSPAPAAGRSRR